MSDRTGISTLGEFGLIRHLANEIKLKNPSMPKGVGNDAVVLDYTDKQVLVTTDLLLEGIHLDLIYVLLKHLGYKSAVVNFSDIYAMNGRPKQITVLLGISKRFCVEDLEESYKGVKLACDIYDVDLVGGDTSVSRTGLAISITRLGEGEKGEAVYRNGVKEAGLTYVSGDLGATYMGLQLPEREKSILNRKKGFTSDSSGKEYLSGHQLKPEARKDIVEALGQAGIVPTSTMDISDGLSSGPLHISKESDVGCRVYESRIPINYQTAAMAEQSNMNLIAAILNGGEDYGLLFTVPLADHDKVSETKGIRVIGRITKPELGSYLTGRDGGEAKFKM